LSTALNQPKTSLSDDEYSIKSCDITKFPSVDDDDHLPPFFNVDYSPPPPKKKYEVMKTKHALYQGFLTYFVVMDPTYSPNSYRNSLILEIKRVLKGIR